MMLGPSKLSIAIISDGSGETQHCHQTKSDLGKGQSKLSIAIRQRRIAGYDSLEVCRNWALPSFLMVLAKLSIAIRQSRIEERVRRNWALPSDKDGFPDKIPWRSVETEHCHHFWCFLQNSALTSDKVGRRDGHMGPSKMSIAIVSLTGNLRFQRKRREKRL